ncbi:lantibiotic dehydratase [Streptomyces sp. NPDC059002]|uniref:lantibiotic dehydratase n=1 Tax=Streptomyces sp. NPDC059002 TaxID=3346690 RepID=UPI0036AE8848
MALLRAAVLPLGPGSGGGGVPAGPEPEPDPGRGAGPEPERSEGALRAELARLTADPAFMAAVELASPSLAGEARRAVAGEPLKERRLRRLVVSLVKYHLRMTYRATPFGLFAGVALAGFGPAPRHRLGTGHHAVSRPDAAWLDAVLATLRATPGALRRTRLVANGLRTERDGRLVLVDFHDGAGSQRLAHSVRHAPVVRHALECAAAPITWDDLAARLSARFPDASADAVDRCITQLTQGHFLLSDLTPPPDCTHPLSHVLERLDGWDHPLADALREIGAELAALDAAPPATRGRTLAAVTDRMRALHTVDDVIQSDLRLDADLVLPREVEREAERAASALWRTSLIRPGSPQLRDYHLAFLERYGTDRLVPVLELLDEGRGLGLPDAYRKGSAARPEPHPDADRRDRALAELFLGAVRRGGEGPAEVELDDAALDALAPPEGRRLPGSLEIGAELLARDWQELCDGDFRLLLGANPGSPLGGATFSRFASVLGEESARVRELALRGTAAGPADELVATVAYRPRVIRSANVAAVPQWPAHRIPLGVGPAARPGVTDLDVAHLAVHADLEGLRLYDTVSGRRVRPVSYSMLNPATGHVPHVARFLLELGQEGHDWCIPWNWGAWSSAPAQPRVARGRTVLAAARWLPDRELLDAAAGSAGDRDWFRRAAAWRRRWGVPRHVLLTRADNRIAVDLEEPLHLRVLREELKKSRGLSVVERYGAEWGTSWFTGPDGAHAAEFVFPLVAGERAAAENRAPSGAAGRAAFAAPEPAGAARARATHLPGGEWLYAKIYLPDAHQVTVLTRHVPEITDPEALAAAGVDNWFLLRYADPDPHLRVRFHGDPARLWSVLLPVLNRWTERLRDAGLVQRLVLDTYDPELERYGGAAVHGHAERVFHTDSAAVVAQLALPAKETGDLPEEVLAALGILDVLTGLGTPDEVLGWLGGERILARRGDVPRDWKNTAAALLDLEEGCRVRPPGPDAPPGQQPGALPARWAERATALDGLRAALTAEGVPPDRRASVAMSLAHMHCNRLLGTRQDEEVLAHTVAREALALRIDRKRHGR